MLAGKWLSLEFPEKQPRRGNGLSHLLSVQGGKAIFLRCKSLRAWAIYYAITNNVHLASTEVGNSAAQ